MTKVSHIDEQCLWVHCDVWACIYAAVTHIHCVSLWWVNLSPSAPRPPSPQAQCWVSTIMCSGLETSTTEWRLPENKQIIPWQQKTGWCVCVYQSSLYLYYSIYNIHVYRQSLWPLSKYIGTLTQGPTHKRNTSRYRVQGAGYRDKVQGITEPRHYTMHIRSLSLLSHIRVHCQYLSLLWSPCN